MQITLGTHHRSFRRHFAFLGHIIAGQEIQDIQQYLERYGPHDWRLYPNVDPIVLLLDGLLERNVRLLKNVESDQVVDSILFFLSHILADKSRPVPMLQKIIERHGLPNWCFYLDVDQTRLLLQGMLKRNEHSDKILDDLQRLLLQAGWSGNIEIDGTIRVNKEDNQPEVKADRIVNHRWCVLCDGAHGHHIRPKKRQVGVVRQQRAPRTEGYDRYDVHAGGHAVLDANRDDAGHYHKPARHSVANDHRSAVGVPVREAGVHGGQDERLHVVCEHRGRHSHRVRGAQKEGIQLLRKRDFGQRNDRTKAGARHLYGPHVLPAFEAHGGRQNSLKKQRAGASAYASTGGGTSA